MTRLLYSLLLYLLLPILLLRSVWRARRQSGMAMGAKQGLAERLGFVAPDHRRPLLVHCVSVGETQAAMPLVEVLLQRGEPVWITSTTLTGAARVRALFGDRVAHSFLPIDTPGAVRRFLRRTRPIGLLVMETEIWPNLLAACAARALPAVLVNARLSEKSACGYARFPALTKATLAAFSVIITQSQADAARFALLGAPHLETAGNLKFDQALPADLLVQASQLRAGWGARHTWIAASTHAGEDEIILAAHRRLRVQFPGLLLVLVPRHPERFDAVAALIRRMGFALARRSRAEVPTIDSDVYLGDSMGELPVLYACADVAFVGGTFSGTGGHNLLEPAAIGLPLLSGPSLFNFQQIADALLGAGALQIVEGPDGLVAAASSLLADVDARRAAGRCGQQFVRENRGALSRTLAIIDRVMQRG